MKRILTLLLLSSLLFSCDKEDSESNNPNPIDEGPGPTFVNLSLTQHVFSAINDEFETFEMGDIVWDFNFASQEITVSVADGIDPVFLNPGTYSFTLEDNVCNYGDNRYIHPDGRLMGLLILDDFDEGVITISDACVDGPIFTFERN